MRSLIENLLHLNGGILQLDVEKFVGYLWVGLGHLFWNNFGAVWDFILCMKTRLIKILSWNAFKILHSRILYSHRLTRYSQFWFFNLFDYLHVEFYFCFLAGNTCIHVNTRTDFCIFKSSVLVFCWNSVSRFLYS